jgi:hypothetical protein
MSEEAQTTQQTPGDAAPPINIAELGKPVSAPTERMASRDELLAAMREAKDEPGAPSEPAATPPESAAAEAPPAAATEDPPAKAAPTLAAAAPPAAETPPAEPKIAALIRAREEAQKKRQEGIDDGARIRAEAEAYREQAKADARAAAAKLLEEERAKFRTRFGEAPLDALDEAGIKRDQLVDEVAKQGTPEWRMLKRLEAERAADRAKIEALEARDAARAKRDEESQQQAAAAHRMNAERRFLEQEITAEKTPNLKRLPPKVVAIMAWQQVDEWKKMEIPFEDRDVADYLEHQLRTSGGVTAQQVAAVPASVGKVKAQGNGTRTLTAQSGSERRASPKPFDEITDPHERRQALIEAAREAAASEPAED